MIVFDDASTDNSVDVIEAWIRRTGVPWLLLAHDTNMGICRSLNDALRHARGQYIAMVAADDAWLPDKTAGQVHLMERLPSSVGMLYSNAYQIDEGGNPLPELFIEKSPAAQGDARRTHPGRVREGTSSPP